MKQDYESFHTARETTEEYFLLIDQKKLPNERKILNHNLKSYNSAH